MAILEVTQDVVGEVDVDPPIVRIQTNDVLATVIAPNYLTPLKSQGYYFAPNSVFIIGLAGGASGFFSLNVDTMTLVPDVSEGNVILPVVVDNLASFANVLGVVKDSGVAPSDNGFPVVASVDGATVVGHIAVFSDIAGTIEDGGPAGSGTVGAGTIHQVAAYPAAGTSVGGVSVLADVSGATSIDWPNRVAYATDGTTEMMRWNIANHLLLGPSGGARVDIVGGGGGTTLIATNGAGADIGMTFETKGAGSYAFTSGTTGLLGLTNQAGAVNGWQMAASTTGNAPVLAVLGSDANINMQLSPKGTGVVLSNSPISAFAGLRVSEAVNSKQGVATLVAGSAVVANTSITATSRIFLTSQVDGGAPGFLRVSTRAVGASFTITSSNGADTSTVAYLIMEPA